MKNKSEIVALSAAAVSTMLMSMQQMQSRSEMIEARNMSTNHENAIKQTLDSTHVQGMIRANLGNILQNTTYGQDVQDAKRINVDGDVNTILRATMIAQTQGQRDSTTTTGGFNIILGNQSLSGVSCYSNCHSACHGSRGWR